jgi:hypothetical protein
MRNMRVKQWTGLAALGLLCALAAPVQAADIDFEGLEPGTILYQVSAGVGATADLPGTVGVFGFNPKFGAGTNAAVVFDSSDNYVKPSLGSQFLDLGTPNEVFGGPGVGEGGETTNDTPLYNILVVEKYLTDADNDGLVDQPDDDDRLGMDFEFDFSTVKNNGKGTVTVNSVTLMDIERDEGETGTNLILSGPGLPPNLITIPNTDNNGVVTIDGIGLSGVDTMIVEMNGSGALVGMVVEEDQPGSCWITSGGFHNAGIQSGSKDFTFGGNVGPPASGSWEVIDHNSGDNFHTNDVHITDCSVVNRTGPDQPGGKKGFTINRADFAGTGSLNHTDGYPFTGYVLDGGEPAGKKNKDKDHFSITVYDPTMTVVVFEADGDLDGGNVQIHPPVGKP